jgi:glycosyltransferase involved in cell wall biosynthesis
MRKIRILVSAYACNPLATEESFPGEAILGWNLVKQLTRFHELAVITREYNREALEDVLKRKEIENVHFYYVNLPYYIKTMRKNYFGFRIYYWLWQIKAYFLAKRLQKEIKFDMAHQITFSNDWMPSYIGALLPIPFIWGPIGGGQKVPKGFEKILSLKDRINEKLRVLFQEFWRNDIFRKKCAKKALAILVCNQETQKKISRSNGIYFFPVNGISSDDLANSVKEKNTQKNFQVLYAGRLDPIKGLPLGIEAFKIFSDRYPDASFEIIGEGPEESRLKKLVDDLKLDGKVFFTSWLPHKELLEKMHDIDVFLFPSFRDGGGAVVVEAMSSGIPVICLNTGGPGFHIQDEWGIKIEPKNPEYVINEIAKALEKLYLDKDLRERLGKAARKRSEEFYLWDRLGEKMEEIYEEALELTSN